MSNTEYASIRAETGLSQAEIAKRLGIARQTVSKRECGDPKYPIDMEAEHAILRVMEQMKREEVEV